MNASPKNLPAKPPDDPDNHTMPLLEHIMELRQRLIYSIGTFLVAFFASVFFSKRIYDFLEQPLAHAMSQAGGEHAMIYTHLAEAFVTQMKVAFFAAAFITFPMFANQIWKFVAPGLYRHEKRAILPFLFAAPVLFFMGGALAYYVVMPLAWKFLLGFQSMGGQTTLPVEMMPKVSEYLDIFMTLIFAFGLAFQMPVLLVLLVRVGIISTKTLVDKRRYAIILVFIFSAVVTPPDIISMCSLAVPMLVLYELAIVGARFAEKKEAAQTAADGSAATGEDTDFNAS